MDLISGKSILIPYRHLIYTLAVAEHGSVQAASNRIAISQPALSAAIQKVEQNYGLKIFLRARPNKLILTPDGKRFIARAKVLMEGAEEFEDNIRNLSNIFVNQGPGKFSGIRASLATAKAISFVNKIDLYCFNSDQVIDQNYVKIIDLFNKGVLIKNLIKPYY